MHLLLGERGLSPAEIGHHLRAMGKGLPRPSADHAGQRGWIKRGPVHRSRLLFHHPPTASPAAAIEIVVEGGDIGMALPQITRLILGAEPELLKKPEGVAIPTGDIEVLADRKMVKLGIETHEVMDHVAAR